MQRAIPRVGAALAAAGLGAALTLGGASAASASGASYTHNNNYGYSELRNSTAGLVIANLYNNTPVSMRCYTDAQNAYGNYWTTRWFYVTTSGGGGGYITASYVFNQTSVPHC